MCKDEPVELRHLAEIQRLMSETAQGKQLANVIVSLLPTTVQQQINYINKMTEALGDCTQFEAAVLNKKDLKKWTRRANA